MKAEYYNERVIKITFDYQPGSKVLDLVRSLDDRRWNKTGGYWTIPLANSATNLSKLQEAGFEIDPQLVKGIEDYKAKVEVLASMSAATTAEFESNLPLLPYQRAGARFLYTAGSAVLGDDVGLGKTIQSIAVAEKYGAKKVLVLCPAVLKYQWQAELVKFVPDRTSVVIDGDAKTRSKQWQEDVEYYIANYELLLRDFPFMVGRTWDVMIADEATRLSNHEAKTTKAAKKVPAYHKFALTGTPISNRPDDCFSIIDFVAPGALGSFKSFADKYLFLNQWGGVSGYKHLEELRDRIKPFMIRRLKVDVLPELPPKQISDVVFKLSDREWWLYDKLRQELLYELQATDYSKMDDPMTIQMTLVKMLRLQQTADSLELIGENFESSKLDTLKEILAENKDRKVIVFTKFKQMANILERELQDYKPLKITGDISDKQERQRLIDLFNTTDDNRVFVMTDAGAYGLNLQHKASVIVHFDLPYSIAKLEQREGRVWRLGQKENVLVYNLIAKGTMDEKLKQIIERKRKLNNIVLGDGLASEEAALAALAVIAALEGNEEAQEFAEEIAAARQGQFLVADVQEMLV